jgi:hypothetical protein
MPRDLSELLRLFPEDHKLAAALCKNLEPRQQTYRNLSPEEWITLAEA